MKLQFDATPDYDPPHGWWVNPPHEWRINIRGQARSTRSLLRPKQGATQGKQDKRALRGYERGI